MMNGYSVTEAASVLGVPTERVWELLARGVLSGEPEGETGMRVFLQPRPAPVPVTASVADGPSAARSNGPERELSPFRELLTEFRSLTERYGQALLALGEARGEVASLRSRVDLLEARIDLRLPMGGPPQAPWPTQSLPVSEPAAAAAARAEPAVEHDDEEAHRRRRRGARRATESFAQALARAEDPSLVDPRHGTDADALAAFRSDAEAAEADRVLPREGLPAEPMLVAEEAPPVEMAEPSPTAAGEEGEEQAAELVGDGDEAVGAPVASDWDLTAEAWEPAAAEAAPVAPSPASEPEVAAAEPPEPASVAPEPVEVESELIEPEAVSAEPEPVERFAAPPVDAPDESAEDEGPPEPRADEFERAASPVELPEVAVEAQPIAIEPPPAVSEFEAMAGEALEAEPDVDQAEPQSEAEPLVEVQPQPAAEPAVDVEQATAPETGAAAETEAEPETVAEPGSDAERLAVAASEEAAPARTEAESDAEPEPADFDAERYTTVIEQPDWLEAEADDAWPTATPGDETIADIEESAPSADTPPADDADAAEQVAEEPLTAEPDEANAAEQVADEPPTAAPGESGADEMEVAGGGQGASVPDEEPPESGALPGSRELDEALEAFGELGGPRPAAPSTVEDEWPPARAVREDVAPPDAQSGFVARPRSQAYSPQIPSGPATRAYRRLRRIFPT